MSFYSSIVASVILIFSITACKDQKAMTAESQAAAPADDQKAVSSAAHSVVTDQWVGQWNGPEGTFLKLSGTNGKYEIIIQNLDGPQGYTGISVNNEIQFERNGVIEKIHATNGAETGMKWLSEKSSCLTIHYGEGFCKN